MTSPSRYRIRQTPTDVWSVRERLCLASSVLRSGDQNWVSVSRAIKPFGEPNRPPDWFSQKNCALQYSDLLEKVEAPKRKRWDRADKETPGDLIVRKLTMERVEELKKSIQERQMKHKILKSEIEMAKCGHLDDKLNDVWNQIKDEVKSKEVSEKEHQKWLQKREEQIAAMKALPRIVCALPEKKIPGKISRVGELKRRNSSQSEQSEHDSAVDSPISEPHSIEVDDAISPLPSAFESLPCTPTKMAPPSSASTSQHPTPSTSPLLTSLLKSPTPTAPASPISSILSSPSSQPKEGTLASQLTSPRSISTPQPFFSPTSALATAAARQLAVATASLAPGGSLLFSPDKKDSSPAATSTSSVPPVHSVTLSAPTLSRLLEMPPSVPGKLPPLPIVHPSPSSTSSISTSVSTEVQSRPVESPSLVPETEVPKAETETLISPVTSVSNMVTSVSEEFVPIAIKLEPPDTVPVPAPSAPEETATVICLKGSKDREEEEEVLEAPTKLSESGSPSSAVAAKKENEVELSEESVMHSTTDIVIEGKGSGSAHGEEQVIVMEVDFAGQVKDEKGEIIEVFEVTAPEGSIVELEYETICEEDEESKVEEHVEMRTEGKTPDESASSVGEVADLPATVAPSENEDAAPETADAKEETLTPDDKFQDGEEKKISELEPVTEEQGDENLMKQETVPTKDDEEEKVESQTIVEMEPKGSETSEKILEDVPVKSSEVISSEQDEFKQEPECEQNIDERLKEAELSDKLETKDALPASKLESATPQEEESVPSEPVEKEVKEEDGAEEELSVAVKKDSDDKDEPELVKENVEEVIAKLVKRTPKRGRRGRGRGGGKTFADVEVESKPFQDEASKSKDEDDEEEEDEQKMDLDRVESAAESETSEVVSLIDQSTESAVEPVSDAGAEVSGDSDENYTANEGEDTSKDNLLGNESLEEESAAEQSHISVESEDKHQAPSSVTDSIPNSPASTAPSDDQESIRDYKVWKKAIMLVWRAAANHKFANVFLHPVTNDVAPGYHCIVYRPMDLSVIKKNIENGVIRSTMEFQRDMMMMFQNAIMYNNSDHDVHHMAFEMQKEVMEQIQDFLATQLMLQTAESKVLRVREREARERKSESTDKEDDLKRKRTSTSNSDTEVKVKKRKT